MGGCMGHGGGKTADSIARAESCRTSAGDAVSKDEIYILHLIY